MNLKLKILSSFVLLILLMTGLTLAAYASSPVFVRTDGSDTTCDGTADAAAGAGSCAFQTVQHALNVVDSPGVVFVRSGTFTQSLAITRTVTLQGNGASSTIISGTGSGRVVDISNSAVVTITGVTITNGSVTGNGGGIRIVSSTLTLSNTTVTSNSATLEGGGIYNENGTVTLNNSTVSKNIAGPNDNSAVGGGISNIAKTNNATLTLNQSQVTTNTVSGVGGGGINNSADSNKTATVVLSQTLVSGNVATSTSVISTTGFGGGIRSGFFNTAGSGAKSLLTIDNSTISNNTATNGGGIGSGTSLTGGGLTLSAVINNSTISNNLATHRNSNNTFIGNGGGLLNQDGVMQVINSTISGNSASGGGSSTIFDVRGWGGGIANSSFNLGATFWLTNTTITTNTATFTGTAVVNAQGAANATTNYKNTILAGSCGNPNPAGTLSSKGYNLGTDNSCVQNGVNNDKTTTNPQLGPLQDNGGDTETHALLSGSPALNSADNAACPATDQRGVSRPQSAQCDMGAYEASTGSIYLPTIMKNF